VLELSRKALIVNILYREVLILFKGVSTNTIHYKLILEFEDNKPLQILETESRAQIKKRVKNSIFKKRDNYLVCANY